MKIIKALLITTWLYSLLLWFYIVVRITIDGVNMYHPFITSIPYLSFFSIGVISFALSFICLFIYLAKLGMPEEEKQNKVS